MRNAVRPAEGSSRSLLGTTCSWKLPGDWPSGGACEGQFIRLTACALAELQTGFVLGVLRGGLRVLAGHKCGFGGSSTFTLEAPRGGFLQAARDLNVLACGYASFSRIV